MSKMLPMTCKTPVKVTKCVLPQAAKTQGPKSTEIHENLQKSMEINENLIYENSFKKHERLGDL